MGLEAQSSQPFDGDPAGVEPATAPAGRVDGDVVDGVREALSKSEVPGRRYIMPLLYNGDYGCYF